MSFLPLIIVYAILVVLIAAFIYHRRKGNDTAKEGFGFTIFAYVLFVCLFLGLIIPFHNTVTPIHKNEFHYSKGQGVTTFEYQGQIYNNKDAKTYNTIDSAKVFYLDRYYNMYHLDVTNGSPFTPDSL